MASADSIWIEKDLEDKRPEMIKVALAELIEMGIVKAAGENFWVLTRPPHEIAVPVNLSLTVRVMVASVLETYYDGMGMDHPPINPLEIGEGHVVEIIHVLDEMLSDMTDNDHGGPPDPSKN